MRNTKVYNTVFMLVLLHIFWMFIILAASFSLELHFQTLREIRFPLVLHIDLLSNCTSTATMPIIIDLNWRLQLGMKSKWMQLLVLLILGIVYLLIMQNFEGSVSTRYGLSSVDALKLALLQMHSLRLCVLIQHQSTILKVCSFEWDAWGPRWS